MIRKLKYNKSANIGYIIKRRSEKTSVGRVGGAATWESQKSRNRKCKSGYSVEIKLQKTKIKTQIHWNGTSNRNPIKMKEKK
jgi:predicted metal-dependent peptidase